ncbi:hypothetical protein XH83_07690 [Bradyrhizobium sp. CCBAU 53351]|uniref:hypothetical protein n=1 Tax=Bradyrhizobium sp. CCBAU 53351 TaxID=1325114 RepID=UPI0018895BCD|nr:hypothetical protein [Bradyrhizobium sp. CCBAU 53351]QOZ75332.1 hypothetical protein XH83_07690 [Bradyrhizobium sp. CCBAU 53351]
MKKYVILASLLFALCSEAWGECFSSPKPIEDARTVNLGTLLLSASGRYYVLDPCVRISRRQFGSRLKLGFMNNFRNADTAAAFYSVKSKRTLSLDQTTHVSLVRTPGWFGYPTTSDTEVQPVPETRGDPFRGTIEQWNSAHANGSGPKELRNIPGLIRPWHAFVDREQSLASSFDPQFWQINPADMTSKTIVTNYIVRFAPAPTNTFLDFDVYIQDGVKSVDLTIASQIEAFSGSRTFIVVP